MIDLNCDMGESFGRFQIGNDRAIMPYIDSCNIACGLHGGDPHTIHNTIVMAIESGKNIGAHPGYPDLQGFGRRSITLTDQEFKSILLYQIGLIKGIVEIRGGHLHHVKPHGAMYHDLYNDQRKAEIFCSLIAEIDREIVIFTNPGSALSSTANEAGLTVWIEGFADRRYERDGSLVSRSKSNAVIEDPIEAAEQAFQITFSKKITSIEGEPVPIHADTICIHGDTKNAVDIAKAIRNRLK